MIRYLEILTHHTLTNVGGAQYDSSSSSNVRVRQCEQIVQKKNFRVNGKL